MEPIKRGNVWSDDYEYDESDPAGFRAGIARIGKAAGGEDISIRAFELPPGQAVSPYHYEYEEEWLLVLEGSIAVRVPDAEHELQRGDLVRFAPGADGAHKVFNRSERTARVLMLSSAREPAVAVYPDSDKIGVWSGDPADKLMLRRTDGRVDYYDGER
jgi:uncharacterized cupin superfamily protein